MREVERTGDKRGRYGVRTMPGLADGESLYDLRGSRSNCEVRGSTRVGTITQGTLGAM